MRTQLIKLTTLVVFLFSSLLLAQKEDYSNEPGYIDFGSFESFEDGDMVVEVIVEQHLLKMVAKLTKHKDEELFNLLNGLKLVRVNSFEVDTKNFDDLSNRVKKIDKDLMSRSWDRIVRVRDHGDLANVYIKTMNGDKIVGLAVASVEDRGEAAFVNIVGDINLETIGRLSEKFDIPELDKINGGN